ncbi:MAG: nucleotidyltransferase domain-containing protein [bacterium]|nr:nucleotidyltransferase domain-containing protein [bacterium]
MAGFALSAVPSRADAERAARRLIDAGVDEVLLFGSVARGDACTDSDIDLVAVLTDLDYSERHVCRRELEAAASAVVPWPVQVHVTDRPEWRARIERVSTSFERRIAAEAVPLAAAAGAAAVDWRKEMVLPMSDPQEALSQFRIWVLPALADVAESTRQRLEEQDPAVAPAGREEARLNRMVRLCAAAASTVETTLKALAVLYAEPTPTTEDLKRNGHKIRKSLARLERDVPEPASTAVREVFDRHNTDLDVLSRWREHATYPDDAAVVWAEADRLAAAYAVMAPEIAGVLADHLQRRLDPADPELAACSARRTRLAAQIAAQDVHRGLPTQHGIDI